MGSPLETESTSESETVVLPRRAQNIIWSSNKTVVIPRRVEDPIGVSPGDRVYKRDGGASQDSLENYLGFQ